MGLLSNLYTIWAARYRIGLVRTAFLGAYHVNGPDHHHHFALSFNVHEELNLIVIFFNIDLHKFKFHIIKFK